MQDGINSKYYVIEIICDSVHILLPLDDIKKIISRRDIQQSQEKKELVLYQEKEFLGYSLSNLLRRENCKKEEYALLIQSKDIEAILYLEEIECIRVVDGRFYDFPIYLKECGIDYIIGCYMLDNGKLAYQIDLIKLLKKFIIHNDRGKIHE